ncbi:hypothetical protein [Comamonas aquatica]|uniref:hypothetical protein n=1 Tax=Comamonas aquatica TaxID=225991 RepID=UPI00244C25DF|nr:hypothetical protein [Comamonas aquatica]MDH0493789.1 hypothetical protein [Comamonas aquatica]
MALLPEHVSHLNEKVLVARQGHKVANRCSGIMVAALVLGFVQPFGMVGVGAIAAAAYLLMVWPEMKSAQAAEAEYVEYTTGPDAREDAEEGQARA